ncbi:MptD family putative ECF transporter S component [Tissierella pigra]|uniref:MptD family putative ECF transporter S component n=1 Tax=Tissierella pigra TaxID=2607614 RepID=A0A6N7XYR7_9FIRM|nr:MptD family putative ECF transporter S component [Tissierella pigra]MBU5425088.1 MptD family putative ECF transporter S component [Tissierella pigra]MSU01704.1 MptD family putative ECF transporter S component [Tissierella pigra]
MNHKSIKKSLTVKDLVTCGIFTALFFVFTMVGGMFFAPNPILTFLMPSALALLTGPIYLLLLGKVPKHGPTIILGTIMGFMIFITGMYWMWAVFYILLGIAADLIAGAGRFKSNKLNILSFLIFSMNPIGSYMMLWINRESYFSYMLGKGTEQSYVEIMGATAQGWMLPAMIISIIICGLISCLVGKKLLKKQFKKAGMIA